MAKGKKTCKILKDIRREIAKANDIDLVISECTYKGDCAGTCPKCEAEVRYLEQQLRMRRNAGKVVALAGLMAGAFVATSPLHASVGSDAAPVMQHDPELSRTKGMVALTAPDTIAAPTPTKESADNQLFGASSEGMPMFKGGDAALMKYVITHLRRPQNFKEGKVIVQFYVLEDGSIDDVRVVRSTTNEECEAEAIRVVKTLPKFIPGTQNGKPIKVQYILPVTFKNTTIGEGGKGGE